MNCMYSVYMCGMCMFAGTKRINVQMCLPLLSESSLTIKLNELISYLFKDKGLYNILIKPWATLNIKIKISEVNGNF